MFSVSDHAMEISRKPCLLCLTETDFNVSLFGGYCRRTGMIDKILVCLKIVVEETDYKSTICFKCAGNVEKYHDFISFVKKSQTKLGNGNQPRQMSLNVESPASHVKCRVTSYVSEQVFDADHTFSFHEAPKERNESPSSSPFFSSFSPHNVMLKQSNGSLWKTPRSVRDEKNSKRDEKYKRPCKSKDVTQHCSRDFFESQSPDVVEREPKSLDWRLTPDDNIIKRVREKCFGLSDF